MRQWEIWNYGEFVLIPVNLDCDFLPCLGRACLLCKHDDLVIQNLHHPSGNIEAAGLVCIINNFNAAFFQRSNDWGVIIQHLERAVLSGELRQRNFTREDCAIRPDNLYMHVDTVWNDAMPVLNSIVPRL
jgi:hypothetical protein